MEVSVVCAFKVFHHEKVLRAENFASRSFSQVCFFVVVFLTSRNDNDEEALVWELLFTAAVTQVLTTTTSSCRLTSIKCIAAFLCIDLHYGL